MKISIENLEFPSDIKTKVLKFVNSTKLSIEFIGGKNVEFCKTNMGVKELHKMIISNNLSSIIILYNDDTNNYYLNDLSIPITFERINYIVKQHLK